MTHQSLQTCIDDSTEEIIEDVGETLSIEHPVQRSNKDSLLRVEPLTGAPHVVTVGQHPGDDLNLLASHPAAGDLEVPGGVVVGALGEEERDVLLVIKDDINVTLGWGGGTVLARPLYPGDNNNIQ